MERLHFQRAEAVRILQGRCGFPSDEDFINGLECNSVEGVDFGRRDVKIANKIYSYSKGAAMGRFKYPQKVVQMNRTTEDVAAPLMSKIIEPYKDIHLNIDMLYVNQTPFLFAISRDIGCIHCRPMSNNAIKQIQNAIKQIILDYQARGSNVVSAFGYSEFDHLKNWMRGELHVDLDTCAADSHVPRAESAIRFVEERLRSIQCKTPFNKYPKRLTIKMTKRVTILINSSRRKLGVHDVMSPRQTLFGKKFKTPLCKMG